MSGFIVTTPSDQASPEASVVEADGAFWPDIDVNLLRAKLRLGDGMVTHERLVGAIEGALISGMAQLGEWAARQQLAGSASLDQVDPDATLQGAPIVLTLWERAVRYASAAELADAHTDLAATSEGVNRAQDKRSIADDYRRMATEALGQLARRGIQSEGAPPPRTGGVLVDLI